MLKPTLASLLVFASVLTTPEWAAAAETETVQSGDKLPSPAPEAQPNDSESLAKKLSNPIASLISVPFHLMPTSAAGSPMTGTGTP